MDQMTELCCNAPEQRQTALAIGSPVKALRAMVPWLILVFAGFAAIESANAQTTTKPAANISPVDIGHVYALRNDVLVQKTGEGITLKADTGAWEYIAHVQRKHWAQRKGNVTVRIDLHVMAGKISIGILRRGSLSRFLIEKTVGPSQNSQVISLPAGKITDMGQLIIRNTGRAAPIRIMIKSINLVTSLPPRHRIATIFTELLAQNAGLISPLQYSQWQRLRKETQEEGVLSAPTDRPWNASTVDLAFFARKRTATVYAPHFYFSVHWDGRLSDPSLEATQKARYMLLNQLTADFAKPPDTSTAHAIREKLSHLRDATVKMYRKSYDVPDIHEGTPIKTIDLSKRDVTYRGTTYSVRYFLWEATPGRLFPAVLYMPTRHSPDDKIPLVLSPLGCGADINTHNEITSVQRRLANLALRGMAAFTTLGLCQNGIFSIRLNPRNSQTYETLAKIAGANASETTLMANIWLRAIEMLGRLDRIDSTRIGATGYSHGGSQAGLISRISSRVSAYARVGNSFYADENLIGHYNPVTRAYHIIAKKDYLTSVSAAKALVQKAERLFHPFGLPAPKLTVVDGNHNFNAERRTLVAEWLAEMLDARPLLKPVKGVEFDTPIIDYKIPEKKLRNLSAFNLHDFFADIARREKRNRFPRDFSSWPKDRQRTWVAKLIGLDKKIGGAIRGADLIEQRSIGTELGTMNYEAWVVPVDRGIRALVGVLDNAGEKQPRHVELAISTTQYNLVPNSLDRAIKGKSAAATIVLPGYGALSSSQKTTGNLARDLISNFTLLGVATEAISSAVSMLLTRFPNAKIELSSDGVEASIAASFAFALDDRIASLTQRKGLSTFDRLMDDEDIPVPPPIMLVWGIYSAIDIPLLAGMASPRPFKIESESELTEFPAVQ